MPASLAHLARIAGPAGYCSGTLVGPATVLTCGHFFAPGLETERVTCTVAGTRRRIEHLERFTDTDIALVTLTKAIDVVDAFPTFGPCPLPFARTVTLGFGGQSQQVAARPGRLLTALPLAVSRSRSTIARPAALILNSPRAVKGDSGGPVLYDGHIFATQSLILDPCEKNLGVATVSVLPKAIVEKLEALR